MQLRVCIPSRFGSASSEDEDVIVRSELDIRTAGFAAARAVRQWLRQMPFVPSTGDLHFNIYAEVEQEKTPKPAPPAPSVAPPARRKKKARK